MLSSQVELQYNDEVETFASQPVEKGIALPLRCQPSHVHIKFPGTDRQLIPSG